MLLFLFLSDCLCLKFSLEKFCKRRKKKKKREKKGRETPALGLMAQSAEAQSSHPRARFSPSPLTRPTPAPRPSTRIAQLRPAARLPLFFLCFADNRGPRGSVLFFFPAYPTGTFPSDAEPIPKTPGSPCYLAHQAPIKAQGPPRDFPLQFSASRGPYPPRSSSFRSRRVKLKTAAAESPPCTLSGRTKRLGEFVMRSSLSWCSYFVVWRSESRNG